MSGLKMYRRGLPCKLGQLLGRIGGESTRGEWEDRGGVKIYTMPWFITPHGTKCICTFDTLKTLTDDEKIRLKINETMMKDTSYFYNGKIKKKIIDKFLVV